MRGKAKKKKFFLSHYKNVTFYVKLSKIGVWSIKCDCPCLFFEGPGYFYLRVKFYVSDPSKLQEEYTRYHFYLQIRKDILSGKLLVPPSTACLLASYSVQCEFTKYQINNTVYIFTSRKKFMVFSLFYFQLSWVITTLMNTALNIWLVWPSWQDRRKKWKRRYLNSISCTSEPFDANLLPFSSLNWCSLSYDTFRILPIIWTVKIVRVCCYRGQTPADAEFNFLDHAKRLDMYGVDLHRARVSLWCIYTSL